MDLLQLQQRLIEFTEAEGFIALESFKEKFELLHLERFEHFVKFRDDTYNSETLFRIDKLEIRLLCWKPLQETPRHFHPENGCLMKILEGKLFEESFLENNSIKTVYKKGDVGYIRASESHILKNLDTDSVSLHIYSPSGFYDTIDKQ